MSLTRIDKRQAASARCNQSGGASNDRFRRELVIKGDLANDGSATLCRPSVHVLASCSRLAKWMPGFKGARECARDGVRSVLASQVPQRAPAAASLGVR